jgi:hypothetical protein
VPEYDPEYVAARGILLDALEALGSQRDAVVVVGAQAVYLRTGDAGITAVAPYTTDADLVLSPTRVADKPHIDELMLGADFRQEDGPGVWKKSVKVKGEDVDIPVDLMVPKGFAPPGSGRRSVNLPPHDKMIARQAVGLEGTVLDNDLIEVGALDGADRRRYTVRVAGPAALVVAKVHKLRDRLAEGKDDRIADKDAADVYRLMLAVPVHDVLARLLPLLDDDVAGPPCREAVQRLSQLFGAPRSDGVRMAADALRVAVPAERVADVCTGFVRKVMEALDDG